MKPKLFIHGVPDTPAVWTPLIAALGLHPDQVLAPALPGFTSPKPDGFSASKEAYTGWLIGEIESLHARCGPVDLIGHDWGALLALRAASLRPDLIRTWAVSGAVIHADYRGHKAAKRWSTPLMGELVMALTTRKLLEKTLAQEGLPHMIAAAEAAHWNKAKRQCILSLYRSARGLRFTGDWVSGLANLPSRGLVLWGQNDPYVSVEFGASFAQSQNVPFYSLPDTGHWAIAQAPALISAHLQTLWTSP